MGVRLLFLPRVFVYCIACALCRCVGLNSIKEMLVVQKLLRLLKRLNLLRWMVRLAIWSRLEIRIGTRIFTRLTTRIRIVDYALRYGTTQLYSSDFVEKEISPFCHEWDEAKMIPKSLFLKAAAAGFLPGICGSPWPSQFAERPPPAGIKPEEFDAFHEFIICDEMARCG